MMTHCRRRARWLAARPMSLSFLFSCGEALIGRDMRYNIEITGSITAVLLLHGTLNSRAAAAAFLYQHGISSAAAQKDGA